MYSALAGFIEPGETIEDAARREIFEESGIRVGEVRYLSSQPWPFPSSLMIGLIGEALTTDIVIDRDELEDVRWFDAAEVAAMLERRHPDGFNLPLPFAIAHHLVLAAML
jgi:NAD+ diphosphatase